MKIQYEDEKQAVIQFTHHTGHIKNCYMGMSIRKPGQTETGAKSLAKECEYHPVDQESHFLLSLQSRVKTR